MCGGGGWEELGWQPFPTLSAQLVAEVHRFTDADLPLHREAAELSIFPGVPLS
jgi:hypothetical protein